MEIILKYVFAAAILLPRRHCIVCLAAPAAAAAEGGARQRVVEQSRLSPAANEVAAHLSGRSAAMQQHGWRESFPAWPRTRQPGVYSSLRAGTGALERLKTSRPKHPSLHLLRASCWEWRWSLSNHCSRRRLQWSAVTGSRSTFWCNQNYQYSTSTDVLIENMYARQRVALLQMISRKA